MNLKLLAFCVLAALCGPLNTAFAHPPWGIAVDKDGNIYFADILHHGRGTLWKLHPNGEAEALLKDFHAHNVNIDRYGNIYSSHGEESQYLIRINRQGIIDTLLFEHEFTKYNGGNSLVTPNGKILFGIEKHIWEYKDGVRTKINNITLDWNQAIYADNVGNIYATDIGNGLGRIVKITPNGEAKEIANRLITRLDRPYDPHMDVLLGMTTDDSGRMYVAETAGQRIVRIHDGIARTFYKSSGTWFPTTITFHEGRAIILEYKWDNGLKGPRVIHFELGKATTIWSYPEY